MQAKISVEGEDPDRVAELRAWIANECLEHADLELRDPAEPNSKRVCTGLISVSLGSAAAAVPLVLALHRWIVQRSPESELELELDELKLKVKARNTDKVIRRVERWTRGN